MEEFSWGMRKRSMERKGKWERDGVKAEGGRRRGLVGGKIAGEGGWN